MTKDVVQNIMLFHGTLLKNSVNAVQQFQLEQ